MKLPRFLTTPVPPAVLALAEERLTLAIVSRQRDELVRVEAVPLAPEVFGQGPVGLLHVDRAALAAAFARLAGQFGKLPGRVTLVIPTSWARCVHVDVGSLPRRRQEAEEVIRWRLKKLLPCRPEEVRLDFLASVGDGRVIVFLALDRPLAAIEEVAAAAGVQVGRIETTVLAVANLVPVTAEVHLVVVAEPRSLGFAAVQEGSLVLLRQKNLPSEPGRLSGFVAREVENSLLQLDGASEGTASKVEVWVVAFEENVALEVAACLATRPHVTVRRLVVGEDRVPATARLSGALAATLLAAGAGREA